MGWVNILLVFFIIALAALSLWWAFNTFRQIQLQKEFATFPLISIAKLWKKAKFIPEDAKDRESLYLYQDFLAKFDAGEEKYPLMVKNGGVRCLSRAEYDRLHHQKDKKPVSILVTVGTVIYAVCAIAFNAGSNLAFGLCMALIMPVLQVILAFFIYKFNKDKNNYRNQLFLELKEYSVDFLRVTKPFIIVDAYPKAFGKKEKPKFVSVGELTDAQIAETKAFIIRQKEAETKVVLKTVDNHAEIDALQNPAPAPVVPETPTPTETPAPADQVAHAVNNETPAATPVANDTPATPAAEPTEKPHAFSKMFNWVKEKLTPDKTETPAVAPEDVLIKLAYDHVTAQAEAKPADADTDATAPAANPTTPDAAPVAIEPPAAPVEPDADDFSLDSIGIALDAELAKRRKIS